MMRNLQQETDPWGRRGLTLIEGLVVLAVLGILALLGASAVVQVRESARRAACANNLRQVGIGLGLHVASHNVYPAGLRPDGKSPAGALFAEGPFSVHFQILPFLDQTSLYNATNLTSNRRGSGSLLTGSARTANNATVVRTALAVFLCPSDTARVKPGNSYRACTGPFPFDHDRRSPPGGGGAFPGLVALGQEAFRDGLAHTIGLSERLMGNGAAAGFDPRRDLWFTGVCQIHCPEDSDAMLAACEPGAFTPSSWWAETGREWASGGLGHTLYNHVAVPNSLGPDCSAGLLAVGPPETISGGSLSARSAHRSGVQVLTMSGTVQLVRASISPRLWRAWATRAGAESIGPTD